MIRFLIELKNRNFLRLWLAQLISQFGNRINQLALVGLIAERSPGSTMDLAKLLAFTILPVFFIQPIAGVLVDRWDRRQVLFICDIMRGLLVLTIPFVFIYWESLIPIYMIVFFVFSFARFHVPAKMSIIPDLVDKDNLLMANSLVSTTGMIAFCLGAALGGFLIDWYGARTGFIIDSIAYFISAIFLFSMDIPKSFTMKPSVIMKKGKEFVGSVRSAKTSFLQEMKEGFKYLIDHREIRRVIYLLFVLLGAAGAIYVVIIVFIQESFGSVTKHLGVLAVCLGGGLFAGVLAYGRFGKKEVWYNTIYLCLIAGGTMLMAFALFIHFYPVVPVAMGLAFLLGMMIGPIFIASNTIVQVVSDERMRGKVFSALEIVIHASFLSTMMLSSWVSDHVDKIWIILTVGICVVCVGVFGYIDAKRKGGLDFGQEKMA